MLSTQTQVALANALGSQAAANEIVACLNALSGSNGGNSLQIGSASQQLGFFGATPISRPSVIHYPNISESNCLRGTRRWPILKRIWSPLSASLTTTIKS